MEIVSAVVSKIAELSAEPVIKQFTYMFCFNNFVKKFSEQWRSLDLALHRVQHDVDVAIRNAEEIYNDVNKWLEDAKKALAVYGLQDAVDVATKNAEEIEIDVNKWLEDAKNEMEGENRLENEKGKNGKCFTWCPKWICQFKLSKALEKKTETLRKLEEESKKFQKVGHKEPPQDLAFLPSKEFTPSESSKEAFEQIMKALKDDNVNMIGLYGMGGVGKTTLVREVGRRAKKTQLFDAVLLATVSQNPNVMYIQDRMADNLDLHFDKNTIEGRANQLWQRLKTEKKLLVILDDVWKGVNLKEIGIPFGDDHRGCKVLLTTRRRDICSYMECQPIVFLSMLSENEAWALFKINAHLRDEDFNLNTVAKKVARECQGLPIALVTVGRALRGKSVIEWEVASTELKNSEFQHMEQNGEENNAYACLKLSYDYLKHEKTKLCFLLCCLFPEDYDIPIEDLTRYAVSYGLHQDVVSIEDARKQVYVAIKTLKDCCMLLGTETEESVKMHDLVRDVAIQIASSKEHGFIVKAGIGLKEWPRCTKSFESCKTISLMGNKLAELPEGLVCPQLKVLLLELDSDLKVPERFFEGMKEIEVLSLKGGCLSLQSLEFSTNLKSLLLIDCECTDLIWLRKLPRLEILCFVGCSSLEELPDKIGELKELRLLDVTGCKSLRRIPVNLIGRLKKLEELLIGGYSFEGWGVVGGDSTGGMNASLTEVNLLSHLAVLSLKIPRVECIPRDFVFPRLLKYDIMLGNGGYLTTKHPTSTRLLYLSDISAASLNAKTFEQLFPTVSQIGFRNVEGLENIALSCDQMTSHGHGSQKHFLQRLEDVEVYGCRDIHTLFPAKWRQALNNLTSVVIGNCESLEEVFELGEAGEGSSEVKELRLLSSLTRLELKGLPELKCIWKGPTRYVSLQSLVHLELKYLDKLTFIFTPHLAQSLVHLETLEIKRCGGLKHLIGEKDDEREIIPESLGFPKLKTLSIGRCDQLEYVFPVSVSPSLLNLEEMDIEFGDNLKQIFYRGERDALTRDGIINFPRLRELSLSRPKNFTAQLPSLQVLAIEGHEELGDFLAQLQGHTNLREIHIRDCKGAQDRRTGHELSLLSLEELRLWSLPDMSCIWKGLVLSHLTTLEVSSCDKLTRVFTCSMVASLVQLKFLDISDCEELEQIIAKDNDDEKDQILSGSDLQSLCFPNLCRVDIRGCNKLRNLFPVAMAAGLPKLQRLEVGDSSQLLGVFWQDDHASPIDVEKQMVFPTVSQIGFINVEGLQRLEDVQVYRCRDIRTLFPAKWPQALNNLTSVEIENCESLEEVFELGEAEEGINVEKELSSLTRLELTFLPELKCIWKGPTSHVSLRSLIHLKLEFLDKLTFIFTPHLAQSLVHLETLRINYCSGLKHLISEKDDEREIIPEFLGFPKLKTLSISRCNELEYVFPVTVSPSLLNLEEMEIAHCANLKQIFYSGEGDAPTSDNVINFPRLRELSLLSGCSFFGPKNFTAHVPSLQVLYIREHEELGDLLAQLHGHTNLNKITIKDIEFLPSKVFTPSESSKEAFEQIMKALKDDNVNMIGLYGMGGVGKTTLVKEVGRRAKETQLFDEVLLAPVSQNPNVMYMQDRMAESLGLRFDEKTKEGRANRLWQGLKKKKKLLVILDDVWQDVDLEEIGIPFGDDHRGCKVLLTTRGRDICSSMECQQKVYLNILSENEAWALFKINAGLSDEDCNLNTVAKKVARECQGLLIALVTVGRALRDKSTVEWEVASKELKNSQFKLIGEKNIIYSCLKLSYDYLKHEKTKLCFLLCCLFPEDYNIPIEDLTRYTVGYGLHQDVESIEDARKQVYVAIKTLKDCCMLLGTESEKYVKMHDMVRDVAIQIASSKEHGFMVKAGIGLKEWPMSNKSFEGCTTISLMGNKLAQLPEGLVCPQLKVLLLELDNDLKVPERFFEGMKEIEVLSLEGGCLSLKSLEFSTNLQSLLLIHCKCKDDESEIIPDSLGFPKLKTLSIRCCDELEFVFPVSVSPCLLNLEEMEIVFCDNLKQIFYRGEGDALTRDGIINFPQLRKLSLSSCCFFGPKNFTAQLPSLQVLYIEEHEELGDLLAQFQGHTNLREIHITDCEGAQEIIQVGSFVTNKRTGQEFSLLSLKKLDLSFLPDMRCIWKGLVLSHLTILEVCYCQKLTHVFTSSMVASLVQLQFLAISACEELEQIIAKDNDDEKDQILSESDLQSLCFPNLCKVEIKGCNKLRSLFPVAMALGLPKLETLDVSHSSQLLGIFWQDDDASPVNVEKQMVFPNLSILRLENLRSIVCFSLGCDDFLFPRLGNPMVYGCPKLTTKFPRKTNGSMSAPSEVLLIRLDFMPLF